VKHNKVMCFFEEHLFNTFVLCTSCLILFGLFLLMKYLNNQELLSLRFQQSTSTTYYKVTATTSKHTLEGNTQFNVTFGDDSDPSTTGFSVPVSSFNDFKIGDTWAVQETKYSCNKETNLDFLAFISLGHQMWEKPNSLMRRNFKYLHQPLLSSEMQSYQSQVTNKYRDYLQERLIIYFIICALFVFVIDFILILWHSEEI
jgi:hypothetical protein